MTDPTNAAHPSEEKKEEAISAEKRTPKKSKESLKKNGKNGEVFTLQAFEHLPLSEDPALGHSSSRQGSQKRKQSTSLSFIGTTLRSLLLDAPLMLLFALYVAATLLHRIHDDYLNPQIELMRFIGDNRDFTDTTYYHRHCDERDVTATSVDELIIDSNASTHDAMRHMLKHGVSMYPGLLTPETALELREFIDKENKEQEGWYVIENKHRYSWGIDVNMHPALHKYWKELASNEPFVKALQAIVGPDPAIIEFTAITSAYGAKDQHLHQDVIPPASGAKFARTFLPSYSLFITLQDTSYDMGATHVCPGTHLCSEGCEEFCAQHSLSVSGDDIWPQGWGALVNQQTTHKGMGHFKKGGLDRVVIIATFAPRPQTHRGLETRMIGQGGSYSLLWSQWGHTFSDFVHADERMTEPQKTMRSLGLIKGGGWNMISVVSMRISNGDGYDDEDAVQDFLSKGGFWFLPQSWQGKSENEKNPWFSLLVETLKRTEEKLQPILPRSWQRKIEDEEKSDESKNVWHAFLLDTVKRTEKELYRITCLVVAAYLLAVLILDIVLIITKRSNGSMLLRSIWRLTFTYGWVFLTAMLYLHVVRQSNWAKDIRSGKAYRLPAILTDENADLRPSTLPLESDVLIAPQYASDYLASYTMLLEVAHPGTLYWKDLTRKYADGYAALPQSSLQKQFCQSIIEWVREERRFLIQDEAREWISAIGMDTLSDFCHKELVTASNRMTEALSRQVDSLKAEIEYGRWHDKAIHKKTIPSYLEVWEKIIIPPLNIENTLKRPKKLGDGLAGRRLAVLPTQAIKMSFRRRQSLPPAPNPHEPYPGAWFEEGDVVEAMFRCKYNEWYRGKIVSTFANEGTYDVDFEDDDGDEGLLPSCIRPFHPYKTNEVVEFRDDEDGYSRGIVIREYDGGLYDVKTEEGYFVSKISTGDMRRFDPTMETLQVGSVVKGLFGGLEWFPGRIVQVHSDGTYGVQYDDGDYEPRVLATFIARL